MLDLKLNEDTDRSKCKGRVYRFRRSVYLSRRGEVVEQQKFIPMKRLSCPGCEFCMFIDDALYDEMDQYKENGIDVDTSTLTDGDLFSLDVVDSHRDWESGMVDEIYLGFVKLEK